MSESTQARAPTPRPRARPLRELSRNAWIAVVALRVLVVLLLVRVVLIVSGANAEQPLVAALVTFTQPFVTPFENIYPYPEDESGVLPVDVAALLAMATVTLAGALVGRVARALAER